MKTVPWPIPTPELSATCDLCGTQLFAGLDDPTGGGSTVTAFSTNATAFLGTTIGELVQRGGIVSFDWREQQFFFADNELLVQAIHRAMQGLSPEVRENPEIEGFPDRILTALSS